MITFPLSCFLCGAGYTVRAGPNAGRKEHQDRDTSLLDLPTGFQRVSEAGARTTPHRDLWHVGTILCQVPVKAIILSSQVEITSTFNIEKH